MTSNKQERELNPKQKLFCQYYVETSNITQSAIQAGYKEIRVGI